MPKRARAQAAEEGPRSANAHCFLVGDLVEAAWSHGFWVPGKVLATRSRQVLVRYEKESNDASRQEVTGPRLYARENETPRDAARKAGVPLAVLLSLNAGRYPELSGTSRLRAKTVLVLPEIHVCRENETPRAIAARFHRDLDRLLELNHSTVHGLGASSKMRWPSGANGSHDEIRGSTIVEAKGDAPSGVLPGVPASAPRSGVKGIVGAGSSAPRKGASVVRVWNTSGLVPIGEDSAELARVVCP